MTNPSTMFISRPEIIRKMNWFAGRNQSFLFAINFDGEKGFVLSPEEADIIGIKYDIEGRKNTIGNWINKPLQFNFIPVDFQTLKKHLKRSSLILKEVTHICSTLLFQPRCLQPCHCQKYSASALPLINCLYRVILWYFHRSHSYVSEMARYPVAR